MSLSIVTYKWKPTPGYRSAFGPETVNVLRSMVARYYPKTHRFICVTDDPSGIDREVEIVPLWDDFKDLPSPHGGKNPSCYRRLRAFSPEIADVFGPRFVTMDLDCVVTGDLRPIFDRTEDFVCWGDTNPRTAYNGSLILMNAGARPQVWERFNPRTSPQESKASGCFGSDQGWISYCLGPNEKKFGHSDGVYSFRNDLQQGRSLPAGARLVFFHGRHDPWADFVQSNYPWVRAHYQ